MNIKTLLIAFFLFVSATGAMAFEWKSEGMDIKETGAAEGENYIILQDRSLNEIKVRYEGEFSDNWAAAVIKLNKRFREWNYMKPEKLEFFLNGSTLEVLVIPASFTYKGINFVPHIPAGMTFLYDYDLRYNFRVNKNEFFLRLSDKFIDEVSICERIKEAVDDPIAYMKKREPEYFLRKLNELEEAQAKTLKEHKDSVENFNKLVNAVMYYQNSGFLGFGNAPVKNQVIKRVIELKTADSKITKDKIKAQLETEKIEVKEKEIEIILNVFYNEFE